MKRVILILALCLFFSQDVFAGNKGIFEKGYMNSEEKEVVDTKAKDLFIWADGALGIVLSVSASSEIDFYFKDVNGEEVQVSLAEIFRVIRIIDRELVDRVYQKSKEIPKGSCPVCGSEERLTYIFYEEKYEAIIVSGDISLYICGDCGNVYAVKGKGK